MSKRETIEEYLARGGKITVVPPQEIEEGKNIMKPSNSSAPKLYSLDEAAHFFAEKRTKKKKKCIPDFSGIDPAHIPAELQHLLKG